VRLVLGDANEVVRDLGRFVPQGADTYAFAYVDPEGPSQWPWASVEALARTAPRSTDLYALVPDAMGYERLLMYDQARAARYAPAVTRFFGTDAWQELRAERTTPAQGQQLRAALAALYRARLGTLWAHVRSPRRVCRVGNAALYSMLFATNHPAALRLCEWETETVRRATKPQGDLFDLSA
jgi:three-Cys-motif partner protein